MTDQILSQRNDSILTLTINRPTKLNAFTNEMYHAFGEVFLSASKDTTIRCVVVKASGARRQRSEQDHDEIYITHQNTFLSKYLSKSAA